VSDRLPAHDFVVGIDVGGTSIKAALIDTASPDVLVRRLAVPTPRTDANGVIDVVAPLVEQLSAEAPVSAVGLAVPGVIDEAAGRTVFAAVIDWPDTPIASMLSERVGLPVGFGHDVRTAGSAEWQLGPGSGVRELMVVCLGTGIGAAVVSGGVMLRADGYAGQLGHVVVDPGGPACGCGQHGCLGRLSSATAVTEAFAHASGSTPAGAAEVADLVRAGDPVAGRVWARAVEHLADALLLALTIYGSERIVLTGGLGGAGDLLAGPVRRELTERITFQRRPDVVAGRFGRDAGLVGAGLLAEATRSR
jgi:glucokinase